MTHEELYDDELLQYGGLEFPQINYDQYNGRPYRYFYSCGFGHCFSDSLLKMDVHTKELKVCINQRVLKETSLLTIHIKVISCCRFPITEATRLGVGFIT